MASRRANIMIDLMKQYGLSLPAEGTGRNGKILNVDLRRCLTDYFLIKDKSHPPETVVRELLEDVMLAYQWNKLNAQEKAHIAESPDWSYEEKLDGCRMVAVMMASNKKPRFYGRNRSVKTFLPVDYTDKLVLPDVPLFPEWPNDDLLAILLDMELTTTGFVETRTGLDTGAQANAVTSILNLNVEDAKHAQLTTAPLTFNVFDCLEYRLDAGLITAMPFKQRKELACECIKQMDPEWQEYFKTTKLITEGKEAFLSKILMEGKEGVIARALDAPYVRGTSGYRDKTACVKIKRSMSGAMNHDIDAFITGYTNGARWSKQDCIAGLRLSVYLRDEDENIEQHWVATISSIPKPLRQALSRPDPNGRNQPTLRREFYGKVLTIDGMDVSARNMRLAHAKADWEKGFRQDKTPEDCILDRSSIEDQIF